MSLPVSWCFLIVGIIFFRFGVRSRIWLHTWNGSHINILVGIKVVATAQANPTKCSFIPVKTKHKPLKNKKKKKRQTPHSWGTKPSLFPVPMPSSSWPLLYSICLNSTIRTTLIVLLASHLVCGFVQCVSSLVSVLCVWCELTRRDDNDMYNLYIYIWMDMWCIS